MASRAARCLSGSDNLVSKNNKQRIVLSILCLGSAQCMRCRRDVIVWIPKRGIGSSEKGATDITVSRITIITVFSVSKSSEVGARMKLEVNQVRKQERLAARACTVPIFMTCKIGRRSSRVLEVEGDEARKRKANHFTVR